MLELAQLKSSFEQIDNAVCITDDQYIILFINQAFIEIEDIKHDIIGKSSLEIKNPRRYTVSSISENNETLFHLFIEKLHEDYTINLCTQSIN